MLKYFSPHLDSFKKKIPCLLFCIISGRWVMGIQAMKVTPHVVFNCCTEPIPGADPQLIIWRSESNEAILLIFAIYVPSSGAVSRCRGPRGGLFIPGLQQLAQGEWCYHCYHFQYIYIYICFEPCCPHIYVQGLKICVNITICKSDHWSEPLFSFLMIFFT